MNTLSFCPRSCCSNLKQPQSGINTRKYVCASPVGDEDAGGPDGPGGAGGDSRRIFENGMPPKKFGKIFIESKKNFFRQNQKFTFTLGKA